MKLIFGNFLLIYFFISSFQISKSSSADELDQDRPRSCQKYIYDFVMGILKNILTCLSGKSTFKVNSIFEYATRSGCLFKCILQQDGAIHIETGLQDAVASALYFDSTFAPKVQAISLPIVQGCFPLADEFDPKDYWCKSYLPYTECVFGAILKGLIPYGGDCITNPLLGILFSALKYLAPNSPKIAEEMQKLRRSVSKGKVTKCFDKNCTTMYQYKKINGTYSIVLLNKNMEVISVQSRKRKPKPKNTARKYFG